MTRQRFTIAQRHRADGARVDSEGVLHTDDSVRLAEGISVSVQTNATSDGVDRVQRSGDAGLGARDASV